VGGPGEGALCLPFILQYYKSRGCQEGHQVVAAKADPRAIPAHGRPHNLTTERGSV